MTTQRRDHLTEICHITKEMKGDRAILKCGTCGWQWVGHFMMAGPAQGQHMRDHVAKEREETA